MCGKRRRTRSRRAVDAGPRIGADAIGRVKGCGASRLSATMEGIITQESMRHRRRRRVTLPDRLLQCSSLRNLFALGFSFCFALRIIIPDCRISSPVAQCRADRICAVYHNLCCPLDIFQRQFPVRAAYADSGKDFPRNIPDWRSDAAKPRLMLSFV